MSEETPEEVLSVEEDGSESEIDRPVDDGIEDPLAAEEHLLGHLSPSSPISVWSGELEAEGEGGSNLLQPGSAELEGNDVFQEEAEERPCELRTWELYENDIVEKRHHRRSYVVDDEELVFRLPARYEPVKVIGSGAFGIVISAKDLEAGDVVAVKKIRSPFFRGREYQKKLLREILLLLHFRKVGCESVIQLRDLIPSVSYEDYSDVYIVMDLMESDLDRYLDQYTLRYEAALKDDYVRYFMYDILKGVAQTHACEVLHRDLKPGNVLINRNLHVRLCDYGLARGIDFDIRMSNFYVVTRWYRAPELLLMWEKTSTSVDMWSVGCVMAELLSFGRRHRERVLFPGNGWVDQIKKILSIVGFPPPEELFGTEKGKEFVRKLRRTHGHYYRRQNFADLFPDAHPQAIDLLENLLLWDPYTRLSATEAMQHPYFEGLFREEDLVIPHEKFEFRFPDGIDVSKIKRLLYQVVTSWNQEVHHYTSYTLDSEIRPVRPSNRTNEPGENE